MLHVDQPQHRDKKPSPKRRPLSVEAEPTEYEDGTPRILGLKTNWISGETDDCSVDLYSGAGLGSPYLTLRVEKYGEIRREHIDIRPLFQAWAAAVEAEMDAAHEAEHVIDAAPELLDACEAVMAALIQGANGWDPSATTDNDTWNEDAHLSLTLTVREARQIKAALAKARGEGEQ